MLMPATTIQRDDLVMHPWHGWCVVFAPPTPRPWAWLLEAIDSYGDLAVLRIEPGDLVEVRHGR